MDSPLPVTPSPILGLSHVGVKASDLERSGAFYRDFLGFAEHCRLNYLATGELMLVCFKVSDDQWIEVFAGLRPGENRMHQVAFRVADAEAIRTLLAGRGVAVPPSTPVGQMGNFNFVAPDPSGQIIEFVQPLPTGMTQRDRGRFLPQTRISRHLRHARIAVGDLACGDEFYRALGLPSAGPAAPDGAGPARRQRRTTPSGDFVEFVVGAGAEAQFGLEVPDLAAAREELERRPHRPAYLRSLVEQMGPDGRRFLDVFDPDGTCVRLTETLRSNAW